MIEFLPLSEEERSLESLLDNEDLLHDMGKEHFLHKEDVSVGCCPDGRHYIRGILEPFMSMYDETHKLCFLPLPEFGGTLVLDENSLLVLPGRTTDVDYINKIKKAKGMGYKALCLINHFPCAMARQYNIHPLRVVDSLMHAKRRIKYKEGISDITVALFLQITDVDQDRRRIARIPYGDYVKWREKNHHVLLKADRFHQQQIVW